MIWLFTIITDQIIDLNRLDYLKSIIYGVVLNLIHYNQQWFCLTYYIVTISWNPIIKVTVLGEFLQHKSAVPSQVITPGNSYINEIANTLREEA